MTTLTKAPAGAAAAEWRQHWTLPFAAMLGYSTIGLQNYAIGPFIGPVKEEFGWTLSNVMLGLSISGVVLALLSVAGGMLIDRFGPRRVGIGGVLVKCGAFALLGTATGTVLNWSMLWVLVAMGVLLVQSTVWTSAVASRFDHSRGMAMAIALSGGALTAALGPLVATLLIERLGWRIGFAGVGAIWLAISLPPVLLFFRGKREDRKLDKAAAAAAVAEARDLPGLRFKEGIRTKAFVCLAISFAAFAFYTTVMSANLVPLLTEKGLSPIAAASIASAMGVTGIIARLCAGFLLDRMPGNLIGFATQILPVFGCAILLLDAPSTAMLLVAVAAFGIAIGAEMDVALYLASRHFGLKAFAALFGTVLSFGAAAAVIAPMFAGWAHAQTGDYDLALKTVMVVMAVGAIGVAAIGRAPGKFQ